MAAVSDGAGSASRSADGSKRVCELTVYQICSEVSRFGSGASKTLDAETVRSWAASAIELTHSSLSKESPDGSLLPFNATLVGVVAGPDGGCFFHLGDGAAFATDVAQYSPCVMSLPENGENANDTYFFTESNWRDHLRVTVFPREHNLVALMTDGVTPFALGPRSEGPHVPFFAPVSKFLQARTTVEGERALAATLSKDEIRRITGDDKTLVWAWRNQ